MRAPDIRLHYVDFGKRFTPAGATDFTEPAATSEMQGKGQELTTLLNYSTNSSFANKLPANGTVGGISVVFFRWSQPNHPNLFVFARVQRRRENELTPEASMRRAYNQVRYIRLTEKDLRSLFVSGAAPYYELLRPSSEQLPKPPYQLTDYNQLSTTSISFSEVPPLEFDLVRLKKPERSLLYEAADETTRVYIQAIAQSLLNSSGQIRVLCKDLGLEYKLLLVQAVQRLVFPKIGWFTFALNYVADPAQLIQLLFIDNEHESMPAQTGPFLVLEQSARQRIDPYIIWAYQCLANKRNWQKANSVFFDDMFGHLIKNAQEESDFQSAFDLMQEASILELCRYRERNPNLKEQIEQKIVASFLTLSDSEQKGILRRDLGACVVESSFNRIPVEKWLDNAFIAAPFCVPLNLLGLILQVYERSDKSRGVQVRQVIKAHEKKLQGLIERHYRERGNSSLAAQFRHKQLVEKYIDLFDLIEIPLPQPDVEYLIDNREQYLPYLTSIARLWSARYPDFSSEYAQRWLEQVATKQYGLQAGEYSDLYGFVRNIIAPSPALLKSVLEQFALWPGPDKQSEYAIWVSKIPDNLSGYPELAYLAGRRSTNLDASINSYCDATRKIEKRDQTALYWTALAYAVSKRKGALSEVDVEVLLRSSWQSSTGQINRVAKELLSQAIANKLIPSTFVQWLLSRGDKATLHLQAIAREPMWETFFSEQLSEEDALAWLDSVPEWQRERYLDRSSGRNKLYDSLRLVNLRSNENFLLLLGLIEMVKSLPEQYQKEEEYKQLLESLGKLSSVGCEKITKLPAKIRYLLGCRDVAPWEHCQEIWELFSWSVARALERKRVLDQSDVRRLLQLQTTEIEAKDFLAEALQQKLVPRNFVSALLLDSRDFGFVREIISQAQWELYRNELSEKQVFLLLSQVPQWQSVRFYYGKKEDELYKFAKSKYRSDGNLLWQIIQHLPALPDSYDKKQEYQFWINEAPNTSNIPEDLQVLRNPRNRSLAEATKSTKDSDGLFLLVMDYLITHPSSSDYYRLHPQDVHKLLQLQQQGLSLLRIALEKQMLPLADKSYRKELWAVIRSLEAIKLLYDDLIETIEHSDYDLIVDKFALLAKTGPYDDELDTKWLQKKYKDNIEKYKSNKQNSNSPDCLLKTLVKEVENSDLIFYLGLHYLEEKGGNNLREYQKDYIRRTGSTRDPFGPVKFAPRKRNRLINGSKSLVSVGLIITIIVGFFFLRPDGGNSRETLNAMANLFPFLASATPTATLTPTPTSTATPTLLPTSTPTATPSNTPTMTPVPTVTPIVFESCQFEEQGGQVYFEAESYFRQVAGLGSAMRHTWQVVPGNGAVGGAMELMPNMGTQVDVMEGPRLDYRIYANREGEYYVSARALAGQINPDQSDSFYIGVNGVPVTLITQGLTGFQEESFTWRQYLQTPIYLTAGWNTFNVWMREDGIIIDRFQLVASDRLELAPLDESSSLGQISSTTCNDEVRPLCPLIRFPGRVEAEDFTCNYVVEQPFFIHSPSSNRIRPVYRTDELPQGPDVAAIIGEEGFSVINLEAGEWLMYEVEVLYEGEYNVIVRFSSEVGEASFRLLKRNTTYDFYEPMLFQTLPDTGSGTWQSISLTDSIQLEAGGYFIQLFVEEGGASYDFIEFLLAENLETSE